MEMPSLARSPVAPVRFRRSDPARSTKWNLAVSVSNSFISPEPFARRLSGSPSWEEQRQERRRGFNTSTSCLTSSVTGTFQNPSDSTPLESLALYQINTQWNAVTQQLALVDLLANLISLDSYARQHGAFEQYSSFCTSVPCSWSFWDVCTSKQI